VSDYEAIATAPGTLCSNPEKTFFADIKPYISSLAAFAEAWAKTNPCSRICDDLPPKFEGDLHVHPKI
jgi:hypothetical protein